MGTSYRSDPSLLSQGPQTALGGFLHTTKRRSCPTAPVGRLRRRPWSRRLASEGRRRSKPRSTCRKEVMNGEPGTPQSILHELGKVIVGQQHVLELVLATTLTGGHVLLQDRPGVGKTVLAKALGRALGLPVGRIQGTPDLLPTDVTGVHIFQPNTGEWSFRPGPVFTSVLLVDELNRATPKAQSALLEAMAELQVTADGATMALPEPFVVIATQNPLGEAGTYQLGAAQLDRFAVMLELGLPGRTAEEAVLRGNAGARHLDDVQPLCSAESLRSMMEQAANVRACDSIIGYTLDVVEIVREVEPSAWLSVRVTQTLLAVARGLALVRGRDYVAPEDIQEASGPVFSHRLPRSLDLAAIPAIVTTVPVPVDAH